MKLLLILLLCVSAGSAQAQATDSTKLPIDADTKRITYEEVIQEPGLSQAELYTRAKLWFAESFKSAKDVVQADEKDAGIIQGTAWSPMETHFMGPRAYPAHLRLWYTVKMACREGRYRYEISTFQYESVPTPDYPRVPPPASMEELLAIWTKPAAKNGQPTKADLVKAELTESVMALGTTLSSSIKSSMHRKPGTPANGKDW